MKALKLELLPLEDRSVPATLNTFSNSFATAASPMDPLINTAGAGGDKVMVAAHSVSAPASPGSTLGKLAANHNQTLVRDRRGRKSRHR